jgi:digalactosyldiacylglycerol synthase
LVDLLGKHNEELNGLKLDVFGNGDDQESVWSEAKKRNLPVTFFKGRDHADKMLQNYKVGSAPKCFLVFLGLESELRALGCSQFQLPIFSSFLDCSPLAAFRISVL